ncbi:MAG: zinc-ribbon domain-containing protein [Clostridia bacterium]|nr:zinc-ribbon domain-containing protein [Clostridia bacterium]
MYCRNCGKEINDNADVCLHCGVATNKTTANQSSAQQTNVLAIIGFILSFIMPIAGLVLSILGRSKASSYNDNGKGLSLAGIIISSIYLAFGLLVIIIYMYIFLLLIISGPIM